MLIFNHKDIESESFVEVKNLEDINKCSSQNIALLSQFNEPYELAKYCKEQDITYAIRAKSIKDALFANALNANYIIADLNLAKNLQKIATEYLFDSKILAIISNDLELEEAALNSIDGVIYNFN